MVTSKEIAEAIQAARSLKFDRKKIRLEEPIRETGTFMVEIEVGGGKTASVKTIVADAKVAARLFSVFPAPFCEGCPRRNQGVIF